MASNGIATLNVTTPLNVGTYNLTANYSGDSNYSGSASTSSVIVTVSIVNATLSATICAYYQCSLRKHRDDYGHRRLPGLKRRTQPAL